MNKLLVGKCPHPTTAIPSTSSYSIHCLALPQPTSILSFPYWLPQITPHQTASVKLFIHRLTNNLTDGVLNKITQNFADDSFIEAKWRTYFVSNLAIVGSDNGLSPGRRQAIIWTNAGILLIGPLGTNFREILSDKWRPFCLGLNVLKAFFMIFIAISHKFVSEGPNGNKPSLVPGVVPKWHQAITQSNAAQYLRRHMSSLGYNELILIGPL